MAIFDIVGVELAACAGELRQSVAAVEAESGCGSSRWIGPGET
jgi:hypothetical protein